MPLQAVEALAQPGWLRPEIYYYTDPARTHIHQPTLSVVNWEETIHICVFI